MCLYFFFFFFKQKTAYEIYQCDWSSDVCSSDLLAAVAVAATGLIDMWGLPLLLSLIALAALTSRIDRKSVV